jgi:hypothetical protein
MSKLRGYFLYKLHSKEIFLKTPLNIDNIGSKSNLQKVH